MSGIIESVNNIKSFGILVDKLNIEQRDILITLELNKLCKKYYDLCPIVFFQEYAKTIQPLLFARLPTKEIFCYRSPIIANDIKTALLVNKCICATRKILYMWDLEWLYNQYNFNILSEIYHNFEIIVRSQTHFDLFNKVWRKPDYIVEDFNYEQIRNIIIG